MNSDLKEINESLGRPTEDEVKVVEVAPKKAKKAVKE